MWYIFKVQSPIQVQNIRYLYIAKYWWLPVYLVSMVYFQNPIPIIFKLPWSYTGANAEGIIKIDDKQRSYAWAHIKKYMWKYNQIDNFLLFWSRLTKKKRRILSDMWHLYVTFLGHYYFWTLLWFFYIDLASWLTQMIFILDRHLHKQINEYCKN